MGTLQQCRLAYGYNGLPSFRYCWTLALHVLVYKQLHLKAFMLECKGCATAAVSHGFHCMERALPLTNCRASDTGVTDLL